MDWFIFSIFWDLDFVKKDSWSLTTYCWWKKSRTTWDVSNPLNTGIIHINWCRISSINSREVLDCEKVRSNNKSPWIVCLRGIFVGPLKNHLQVGEYLSPGDSIRDPTWSTILGGHLNKQKNPISQPKTKNMFKNGSTSAIRFFKRENFESHPGETAFRGNPFVEFPQHIRSFLDTAMQKTSKSWNAGFGHQEGKPLQKQVTTWCQFQRFVISMEFPGSLNRWYWYILTQLAIYKRYISGIYCQLGEYIYIYTSPTTY